MLCQSRKMTDTMIITGARIGIFVRSIEASDLALLAGFGDAPQIAIAVTEQGIEEGCADVTYSKEEVRGKAKAKVIGVCIFGVCVQQGGRGLDKGGWYPSLQLGKLFGRSRAGPNYRRVAWFLQIRIASLTSTMASMEQMLSMMGNMDFFGDLTKGAKKLMAAEKKGRIPDDLDFGVVAVCASCKQNIFPPKKPMRCASCKAVIYCSREVCAI